MVAAAQQGKRLGQFLYEDLFAFARVTRTAAIACEFDIEPPNEASRRFHSRFGFREVETQWVVGGNKRVSLQLAEIEGPGGSAAGRTIPSRHPCRLCLTKLVPILSGFVSGLLPSS